MSHEDLNKGGNYSADAKDPSDMEKAGAFGGKPDGAKMDGPTDDEPKADKMDKSINPEALDATIGLLENTLSKSTAGRTQELMQKGATQGLTAEESEELRKSLAGDLGEPSAVDQVTNAMSGDEDLNKSMQLDVSGFLSGIQDSITKALEGVAARMEKGFKDTEDNSFVLAKALLDVCKVQRAQAQLVKSLQDELASFGRQPASPPRAAQTPRQAEALAKGFGPGGAQPPVQLSKNDILQTLSDMSLSKAYGEAAQDLGLAIARYESTNEISPALLQRVIAFRQQGQA